MPCHTAADFPFDCSAKAASGNPACVTKSDNTACIPCFRFNGTRGVRSVNDTAFQALTHHATGLRLAFYGAPDLAFRNETAIELTDQTAAALSIQYIGVP